MKRLGPRGAAIGGSDNLSDICRKPSLMKQLLFSGGMKMSDLIQANYRLLRVLPRFGIHLGFGDKSVAEVCRAQGVSMELFLLVCNISTFDDFFARYGDV